MASLFWPKSSKLVLWFPRVKQLLSFLTDFILINVSFMLWKQLKWSFLAFLSSIFVSYTFFTSVIFACMYRMHLVVHAYCLLIVMLFYEILQVWFLLYSFGFMYWTFETVIQFVISDNTFKSPKLLEVDVAGDSFCPGLALSGRFGVSHTFSLPAALYFPGLGPCYITGPGSSHQLDVWHCFDSTLPLSVFVGSSAFSLQFLIWYATPQRSVAGFSRWSGHTILCQGKEISRGQTYFIFRQTGTWYSQFDLCWDMLWNFPG